MKNFKKISYLFFAVFLSYGFFIFFQKPAKNLDFNSPKTISVNDNGLFFTITTSARTVKDFLTEIKLQITSNDELLSTQDAPIYPGMQITINRAVKYKIRVDDNLIEGYSTAKTIGAVLDENKIKLGRLDKISPDISFGPQADAPIIITRINIEEKIISEDIDFKIIANTDSKMSWREEKITQKGEKGVREIKYKITYKNNKEISRVMLEKNILKEPVAQIITKGTYMELGKSARGQGTWYAYKGGLFAASTTIPKGSFVKATNLANNKSVVVQINDYGPQGKGRIIDLDKVAFAQIASLGAGVIGVKVEPVLN